MTTNRLLPLVVSLCCITALGVSATTLESSLSTSPDDVIDVQYEQLPLGKEQLGDVKQQVSRPGDPETDSQSGNPETPSNQDPPDSGETSQSQGSEGAMGFGMGVGVPSLVDRLLDLLRDLLLYGVAVLSIGLASAAGYRYRGRIRDRLAALLPETGRTDESLWVRDEADAYDTDASNAVDRAWLRLLDHADITDAGTQSPRAVATLAVERGLDRQAVDVITREFEAIRYGPAEPTQDRCSRVEHAVDQLDGQRTAETGIQSDHTAVTESDGGRHG